MTQRFAIVTPYHKEGRPLLERCIASVKAQAVKTDHFLIADGVPQDWIDGAGIRHIRLDQPHGDYGNVARGIGALLAVSEAYDGIGFLHADNWLDRNHVGLASSLARQPTSSLPSAASCAPTAAISVSPKSPAMSIPAAGGSGPVPIICCRSG